MPTLDAGGRRFNFHNGSLTTAWLTCGGVYMFVKPGGLGWDVLYVGQTDNLKARLCASHHKLGDAVNRGMTNIHAVRVDGDQDRLLYEQILINHFKPPLNELLVPSRSYGLRGGLMNRG